MRRKARTYLLKESPTKFQTSGHFLHLRNFHRQKRFDLGVLNRAESILWVFFMFSGVIYMRVVFKHALARFPKEALPRPSGLE